MQRVFVPVSRRRVDAAGAARGAGGPRLSRRLPLQHRGPHLPQTPTRRRRPQTQLQPVHSASGSKTCSVQWGRCAGVMRTCGRFEISFWGSSPDKKDVCICGIVSVLLILDCPCLQRVGVASALFMLLMVSNAMWFGTGAQSQVSFKFQLGPVRYSYATAVRRQSSFVACRAAFCALVVRLSLLELGTKIKSQEKLCCSNSGVHIC